MPFIFNLLLISRIACNFKVLNEYFPEILEVFLRNHIFSAFLHLIYFDPPHGTNPGCWNESSESTIHNSCFHYAISNANSVWLAPVDYLFPQHTNTHAGYEVPLAKRWNYLEHYFPHILARNKFGSALRSSGGVGRHISTPLPLQPTRLVGWLAQHRGFPWRPVQYPGRIHSVENSKREKLCPMPPPTQHQPPTDRLLLHILKRVIFFTLFYLFHTPHSTN